MMRSSFLVLLWFLCPPMVQGQATNLTSVHLSADMVVLSRINQGVHHNNYSFNTLLESEGVFLKLPKGLPRGYFEAYYNGDTNRLALVFYNNGPNSYGQQFYKNGSMKSDSEYNKFGDLHGLHVMYDKTGEELWHAEYYFGILDYKYNLKYLQQINKTSVLLQNKAAFGSYVFEPTPSRARREKIVLSENYRFTYQNHLNSPSNQGAYHGRWKQQDGFLLLELLTPDIWYCNPKKMVISTIAKQQILLEVKDWGVEWYNSEFVKTTK